MTMNSYESFLAKLDMVQREMGKQPNEFIPVKYDKHGDDNLPMSMMNIMIGAMFCAFFYSIYKNRNQGMATGLKKGSKSA